MIGRKQSWAELRAENKRLQLKIDELNRALKAADRHPVGYALDRWIAIPLHETQEAIVRSHFEEHLHYDSYTPSDDGDRNYEEVHDSDILPEYRRYLVRHSTDAAGNPTSPVRVWGLEPI